MSINFNDKVAIVTGAGVGLGRSHAIFLASRGAKVVVNDLGGSLDGTGESKAPAKKVVEEILAIGGKAVANYDSVASAKTADNIIKTALDSFGTVDILICNAGIVRDRIFWKMPMDDFDLVMKVHLMGTVYPTRAALPIMKDKKYGKIIMTTSASGLFGNFGQTNYAAAKMAIIGFMNSLKLEVQKYNICVNVIAPLAATRFGEPSGIFKDEIKPFIRPELVTAMVAYLCSTECQITGDIYSAGGGYFSRVQIVEGEGIRFNSEQNVTPEMIHENISRIMDMNKSISYFSIKDELDKTLGPLMRRSQPRFETT